MITLKEFNLIKKNSDSILKNTKNHFLVANNSLNIIKGHPYHLSTFKVSSLIILKRLFLNLSKLIVDLIVSLRNIFIKTNIQKKNFEILFVSNLINIKELKKEDYIYGNLEKTFKKKKLNFYKLIINHTKFSNSHVKGLIKKQQNISVVDFKSNSFLYNIKSTFILGSFFMFFLLKSIIYFNKFYLLVGIDFLNLSTKKNLNLYKNFKDITKNFSYNKIILPYEGYSWERIILMCNYDKGIKKRIGYNFSAISKYQHSIFRKLKKKFEPDIIFTVGKYSQKKLKKTNIPSYILGSVRKYNNINNAKKSKKKNVLVLPEGIISECEILFHFSIDCAKKNPSINFIWRLHPSQKFESILKQININKYNLPKNIILSKSSFFKDIANSNYCIYRGSTSVITAIQDGVYPLYYNAYEKINIDPTFDLKIWKTEINNLKDFQDFTSYKSKKVEKNIKEKNEAKKFVQHYFQKMDSKVLINMLKN